MTHMKGVGRVSRRILLVLAAVFALLAMAVPARAGVISDERCGEGVDPVGEVAFSRDGGTVKAEFTVDEACENLPVTLAIHEFSSTGNDQLSTHVTEELSGGAHTLTVEVPDCDVSAHLVTGPPDPDLVKYAAEARGEDSEALLVGQGCGAAADPPADTGSDDDEELPFTGASTTTLLLGVGLLAVGALAVRAGHQHRTSTAGSRR
jgi:hypothetical protein